MSSPAMSEVGLKQMLRKMEYPQCAQEALDRIIGLLCGRITSLKNMDLALDLMAEFIFCEVDRRGQKKQPLSALSELQLVDILYEYFNDILNTDSARNTVFLSLFTGPMAGIRLGTLGKLVSMAIAIPSKAILMSAGAWMQQLGNTSLNGCKLAEMLIQDYCCLYEKADSLKELPQMSPQFTANFMTAIAENYYNFSEKPKINKQIQFPPKVLLEIIVHWMTNNNGLCMAAQQKKVALPVGAIAMEATTPLAGLMKWCILAPIYKQNDAVYDSLHLAILNSIMEMPKESHSTAIYAQHLTQLINPIVSYAGNLKVKPDLRCGDAWLDDDLNLCLERFAQAVQTSNSVNAMYGQVDDLYRQLNALPFNKLMSIVISSYQRNKPL